MKLLHFADLHLGIEQYGTIDSDTGLSSRLLDVLKALDQMVDFALVNGVDVVVFCGDAYRTRDPSQTQQRELARRIKRLSDAGLPVFMLVGNHDLPNSPGRANTLEIFQTLGVSNVYVAGHPGIHRIETRNGALQIAALPWLRRSGLLSKEESRGLTIDQMVQRLETILTDTVSVLASSLDKSLPAVLAAHVAVSAAKTGSEKSMTLGREPVLLPGSLALPDFDYAALGHVHRTQVVHRAPPAAYSGSMERVDFGEADDEKGFYVVEIDPRLARILIEAAENRCLEAAMVVVSALSMQDPRETPAEKEKEARAMHATFAHPASDFITLLNIWEACRDKGTAQLKRFCRDHFLSFRRMREWRDLGLIGAGREDAFAVDDIEVVRKSLLGFIDRAHIIKNHDLGFVSRTAIPRNVEERYGWHRALLSIASKHNHAPAVYSWLPAFIFCMV